MLRLQVLEPLAPAPRALEYLALALRALVYPALAPQRSCCQPKGVGQEYYQDYFVAVEEGPAHSLSL